MAAFVVGRGRGFTEIGRSVTGIICRNNPHRVKNGIVDCYEGSTPTVATPHLSCPNTHTIRLSRVTNSPLFKCLLSCTPLA